MAETLRNTMIDNPVYYKDLDTAIAHIVGKEKLERASFLVTGCTGTIGSFLTDVLLRMNEKSKADVKVYAVGRDTEKIHNLFGDRKGLQVLQYDLNKEIEFEVSADYIIHLAGNSYPAAFNSDPSGTIVGCVDSTWRLLEYGRIHGAKRFLFLSSGEVYSDIDILSPRAAYPMSKRTGESLCASFTSQYGLETVIARCCHTFGPYVTAGDNRAHVQFMKMGLAGEDIVLKSSGSNLRSYLYVADSVSALLSVLASGEPGEAYDISFSENTCTIAELAGFIAEECSCRVGFEEADETERINLSPIMKQVLDDGKLIELGWKSAFSIIEGVRDTLNIMREER